jgi:hypothetical protein
MYLFFPAPVPGAGPGLPFFFVVVSTAGVDLGVVLPAPLAALATVLMLLAERSIAGAPATAGAFSTFRLLVVAALAVPLAIPSPLAFGSASAFFRDFPVCVLFVGRSSKSESTAWVRLVFLASRRASPLAAAMS